MGSQRVLQAVVAVAVAAGPVAAAPRERERVAVIDLGDLLGNLGSAPGHTGHRFTDIPQQLAAAIAAAGFEPVTGDGVEDALAGRDVERDAVTLSAEIATAERAFGAL